MGCAADVLLAECGPRAVDGPAPRSFGPLHRLRHEGVGGAAAVVRGSCVAVDGCCGDGAMLSKYVVAGPPPRPFGASHGLRWRNVPSGQSYS